MTDRRRPLVDTDAPTQPAAPVPIRRTQSGNFQIEPGSQLALDLASARRRIDYLERCMEIVMGRLDAAGIPAHDPRREL